MLVAVPLIVTSCVAAAVVGIQSANGTPHRELVAQVAATAAVPAAAPPAAVANPDCTLVVPGQPLTARGLATPYRLVATNPAAGACNEANADQSAFVQAAIIAPSGRVALYNPLIIDDGTQPAAPPAPVRIPRGSTVAIWFGFNGGNLTLRATGGGGRNGGDSLRQGRCVNGLPGSIFGQFAYCNAPSFFHAANRAIARHRLVVPPLGTATDGLPCPTVRDFAVVDQDQSDNVTTHYLANANGQTAQPNAAGVAGTGANARDLANGSDNRLLVAFVDPALGCTPFTAPDLSNDGKPGTSLALDELQAAVFQDTPSAVVPLNDPMATINGALNVTKTNLFRIGVNQPLVGAGDTGSGTAYCRNLFNNPVGLPRVFADMALLSKAPSPDPAAAQNLFTFLATRASGSFSDLGCGALLKQANPVTLTADANGLTTAATFTLGGAVAPPAAAPAPAVSVTPAVPVTPVPATPVAPVVATPAAPA